MLLPVLLSACLSVAATDAPPTELRTGKGFLQALELPLAAAWENADLRSIARDIGAARGVSVLLDRRLDPTREITIAAADEPLRAFLERLAGEYAGKASVVGDTVYLGPSHSAA